MIRFDLNYKFVQDIYIINENWGQFNNVCASWVPDFGLPFSLHLPRQDSCVQITWWGSGHFMRSGCWTCPMSMNGHERKRANHQPMSFLNMFMNTFKNKFMNMSINDILFTDALFCSVHSWTMFTKFMKIHLYSWTLSGHHQDAGLWIIDLSIATCVHTISNLFLSSRSR